MRHRGKITATIANAIAVGAMRDAGTSLEADRVVARARRPARRRSRDRAEIPAETPESAALARALRKWGMRYVGATTVYAFMQSAGLVDDHLAGCHRAGTGAEAPDPRSATRAA